MSNTVVFTNLDIAGYLMHSQTGNLPFKMLPVVTHELTHHWCFSSLVGHSLSLLALESRTAIAANQPATEAEFLNVTRCELAYNFTLSLFHPLLEGMASFAEFDLAPGESEVVSALCAILPGFFLDVRKAGKTDIFDELGKVLKLDRLQPAFLNRKKAVFSGSMDCTKSSYLAGYLTLRCLYHRIANTYPEKMNNTDFFLLYLRNFIFDDPELALLLLKQDTEIGELPVLIMKYFANRLFLFCTMEHREMIQDLERHLNNEEAEYYFIRSKDFLIWLPTQPITPHDVQEDVQRLINESVERIFAQIPAELDVFQELVHSIVAFRGLLCLAHNTMTASINGKREFTFITKQGDIKMKEHISKGFAGLGKLQVEVDLVYWPAKMRIYLVVSAQDSVIHYFCMTGKREKVEGFESFASRSKVLELIDHLNHYAAEFRQNPFYTLAEKATAEYLEEHINLIYTKFSPINSPEQPPAYDFEKLFDEGIKTVLEDDDLLDNFVMASTICANRMSLKSVKTMNIWPDKNVNDVIETLNKKLGFSNFGYQTEHDALFSLLF